MHVRPFIVWPKDACITQTFIKKYLKSCNNRYIDALIRGFPHGFIKYS